MHLPKHLTFLCLMAVALLSCQRQSKSKTPPQDFQVDFEKFTLDNGLTVVFHVDKSDPVVAVALTSHVGSAREKEGRTGFAHLFEHLLFLESENLGKGGLDKMSARIGGSGANGSTNRDRTNYYQTVPNDALEKMIWAEADKLGFFINTVTDQVLAKEKQVVKNEKRQSYDNAPYGHTSYVIDQNLYPKDHPYHWQVIGSLEDLQNATLADVKEFYRRWYAPNNVTLVVSGDFEPAQAKAWVEKYFAEIKKGADIPKQEKRPAVLSQTKKLYHEDNFARLPELTMAWPTIHTYHKDSYALRTLATLLTDGKKAPLNKLIVDEKQLAGRITMYQSSAELAGQLMLSIRGYEKVDLDQIHAAVEEAFARFEQEGFSDEDLARIKAVQEVNFYNSLSSVQGKGFQLAQYQIFAGDPGFISKDIQNMLAVTREDVMRVFGQYIKNKPYVATSFVPKGQAELALAGSQKASVVEEKITEGAEEKFDATAYASYPRTPSSFDRTVEPPYGKAPETRVPAVWEGKLKNGLKTLGIVDREVPLVQFNLRLQGGLLLEDSAKVGVSNLLAELLLKGTKNKTTAQLEEAIEALGASISVNAGEESITVSGRTLARNYAPTMALVQEILLEPRWDEQEFKLAKQRVESQIKQQKANPNAIAENQFRKLLYGPGHILSRNILGTEASLQAISFQDLKNYYAANLSPTLAAYQVVGAVSQPEVLASLSGLEQNWKAKEVFEPRYPAPAPPKTATVYFYDVPGAKQSVLRLGYLALPATHPDFYPAQVMNYILGGGGFASKLTQQLREGKGYTYGISSSFGGSQLAGPFQIQSGVRSNVTFESVDLIKQIMQSYGPTYSGQDLDVTKGFLVKSNARAFETMGAKLGMLHNISTYGLPVDYAKQREALVKEMTVDKIKGLAQQYVNPNRMYYLIVGDAATQLKKLEQLGFGKPVLLN
ncbi:M16 family metallopeptidase [Rufibacter glacialis]|uniref:Insulinase family protein n=1 Tax=Rufibacter glacialis TaxID=1259555 RepID=A0A5M8Q8T1_9BACT|nr:pitrilysin family protein [Rufibacter glacialis]KAA6432365.1 insulinase family protein [Rufibacter glacialis]GGK78117.1 peptidase M16 [Rufibacter glacialis]